MDDFPGWLMKQINTIIPASARNHWVGDGFNVRPIFAHLAFTPDISPFLMFDYAAPRHFDRTEKKLGVGPHPHRGFETVTIAFQGEVEHGDSVGNRGVIKPGDVQWMTAAAGIVHEEFLSTEFLQRGGTLEMAQLWVNLPAQHKMTTPRYQPMLASEIPEAALPDDAGTVRVIAGEYGGIKGAASTFSPVNLWVVDVKAGSKVNLAVPGGQTAMLFVRRGSISLQNETLHEGDLLVLRQDGADFLFAAAADSSLLMMGGEPINEPIAAMGPFVMNTEQEIRRAMLDYQSGQMGRITV